jgi:DNA-binding PadR family transcriptional regulator
MHHHSYYYLIGRHRGHGGFGRFARGQDEGSLGGRSFGMGRKLGSTDLQLLILALLEEKPRHGYEIIKALDERSNGFYVPSPGMVYPALTYLEEIEHATVATEGSRKQYSITPAGREYLEKHRETASNLLERLGHIGERMDRARRAFNREGDESGAESQRHGSRELRDAHHELLRALLAKRRSSKEDQQRIVEILLHAAAEIAGK